jgi:hypothetical protein
MVLCHRLEYDFVIYLLKDFLILEIDVDRESWTEIETTLVDFYTKNIVPFMCNSKQQALKSHT